MLLTFLSVFGNHALQLATFFLLMFIVEQLIPAESPNDIRGAVLNCFIGFFYLIGDAASAILVASWFTNWPGGIWGALAVSDRGSLLHAIGLAFAWLAARDFFYYWMHRAQHKWAWFWAEHAVHHSDEHLNITTAVRHHWLEVPITTVFVTIPFVYLVRPPLITVPMVVTLIGLVGVLSHTNASVGLGKLNWLIVNPQNHRIHHSRLPEHEDKNFAALFPVWDILFGTYYAGRKGEYPPTGLSTREQVTTLRKSLALPFAAWRKMCIQAWARRRPKLESPAP